MFKTSEVTDDQSHRMQVWRLFRLQEGGTNSFMTALLPSGTRGARRTGPGDTPSGAVFLLAQKSAQSSQDRGSFYTWPQLFSSHPWFSMGSLLHTAFPEVSVPQSLPEKPDEENLREWWVRHLMKLFFGVEGQWAPSPAASLLEFHFIKG